MNHRTILDAINRFHEFKILIVGDVILDAYFKGKANRISPEAPVPILDIKTKEYRLGGAANVALNIKHLGAIPILCSVVGSDEGGQKLIDLMNGEGISEQAIIRNEKRKTSVKTRLMSDHHQMIRMDEEETSELNPSLEDELKTIVFESILQHQPQVIVFQDYDKGCLSKSLISAIVEKAKLHEIKTAVDPKRRNFLNYAGVNLFKPNLRELKDGLNINDDETKIRSLANTFEKLNAIMPIESAFFTLSSDGVFISNGKENHHIPAQIQNISDVSGAGDTVISVAACAMAAGLSLEELAFAANLAGGWVCQFPGVVPIERDALYKEIEHFMA